MIRNRSEILRSYGPWKWLKKILQIIRTAGSYSRNRQGNGVGWLLASMAWSRRVAFFAMDALQSERLIENRI